MKYLLFVVAMATGMITLATTSFVRIVGGPDQDWGVFVTPTADGGYVAVGATRSLGIGGEDIYLVKTDAAGKVMWSRAYGGPGEDNGWSVLEHGGHLVVAGFTNSFGAGGFDCYLIGADETGEQVWSSTFGGQGKDRCWAMLKTNDGGYVLAGETTSSGLGEEDCYLIKVDSTGGEVWSRTYGGAKSDRCFSIAPVPGGGFLMAGQTYSEGAGDRDAYVVRTDAAGTELWTKTFGGSASDVAHFVARNVEGDFIVTGYTTSLAKDEDDPYIIRIDADGGVAWTHVLSLEGVNHTLTGEQTTDGGFVLGGFTEPGAGRSSSALLVKTDADGRMEWSRDLFPTRSGRSGGYTVRATSDGGSVLTGNTSAGSSGDVDLFVVKLDREGR